jgi:hypothetical protein
VTTWVRNGDVAAATAAAAGFSKQVYPLLRETFPR